jgi:predicted nucleic acid-binding protein
VWLEHCIAHSLQIHFPLLIIPELAGVLSRSGISTVEIADEIDKIVQRSTIHLHGLDFTHSLLAARVASISGLKGADAVFVALAANLGIPLVTWDKQQRERGAMFCRTMTPVEVMEMAE